MNRMINWNEVFANAAVVQAYTEFVNGKRSRRSMESLFADSAYAGSFRELVRTGGSARAKELAKKALKRRALV